MIDVQAIRKDFPIFQKHPELVYLDSGATSLKPQPVIDKLIEYYTDYTANVFRGVYKASERATKEYEESRDVVAKYINAPFTEEVIFTRNSTESFNLIAYALGRELIDAESEVVTTVMEHHSNFVPWQQLAFENNATFKVLEVDEEGFLANLDQLDQIITEKTKLFAFTYVSNVLGTINPVKEIIQKVKQINPNVIVVIDGAQAIPHLKIDVQELGCDFFVASSHKMFGPTGIGILWGKYKLLDEMYPFQYGGEMIEKVAISETTFQKPPHKFEAGTPDIAGVIALKEAIRYLEQIGFDNIREHEEMLTAYAIKRLNSEFRNDIRIFGPKDIKKRGGIIAFTFGNVHPHDIAQILDENNISIRAGHHCAQPLHGHLGVAATARVTLHVYNEKSDIDKLVEGLKKVKQVFK
jgi:cysteine desulfurase / selenocysteine lyase